jgi:hypothetical protein
MKISELIHALERIKAEHGDLDVERTGWGGSRAPVRPPVLAHRAKLRGSESKPRFAEWFSYENNYEKERIGEAVCRL